MWFEFGRVTMLLAVILAFGVLIGLVTGIVNQMVRYGSSGIDANDIASGVVFGYAAIFVVFPTLWWKRLLKAVPLAFAPALVVAALAGAFLPTNGALVIAGLVLTLSCAATGVVMPRSWDLDRRGQCPQCGYDLRGNRSGLCPECGEPWRPGSD